MIITLRSLFVKEIRKILEIFADKAVKSIA